MNQLWVLFLGKQTHLIAVSLECEVRFRRVFLCHIKSNTLSFLFPFLFFFCSICLIRTKKLNMLQLTHTEKK